MQNGNGICVCVCAAHNCCVAVYCTCVHYNIILYIYVANTFVSIQSKRFFSIHKLCSAFFIFLFILWQRASATEIMALFGQTRASIIKWRGANDCGRMRVRARWEHWIRFSATFQKLIGFADEITFKCDRMTFCLQNDCLIGTTTIRHYIAVSADVYFSELRYIHHAVRSE